MNEHTRRIEEIVIDRLRKERGLSRAEAEAQLQNAGPLSSDPWWAFTDPLAYGIDQWVSRLAGDIERSGRSPTEAGAEARALCESSLRQRARYRRYGMS